MIRRSYGNLKLRRADSAPAASAQLEQLGYAHVPNVLDAHEIAALAAEIDNVFANSRRDRKQDKHNEFRHGMLSRSPLSQTAIAKRALLDVIEPLLGDDCHVIANTAWRNRGGHTGGPWHIDAGPHVPRPEGVQWPDEIPYPVFAIGMHLFLEDCTMAHGPTAVLPGSHRSGRMPPYERMNDLELTFDNKAAVYLPAKAGDAILFVSDAWHRGTPAEAGKRRFFLQCHYGRRDLAQRIVTTDKARQVSKAAAERAESERERLLIGLHPQGFYDA